MILTIVIILVMLYAVKTYIVYRLRKKRDDVDFSTLRGKLEIQKLNNLIDFLNGYIWKSWKYPMR